MNTSIFLKNITWRLVMLLIFSSLFSFTQVYAKSKPKWVKQRPNDTSYYIGIAMNTKQEGEVSYRTEARNKALKQMSSEIKVNISSNSILRQFENNYQVKEEFEANTYESVEATLEGYEVFTWENKKEYWVMVRLSKEKYALRKKMNLDHAKKLSASYYYDGQKAVNQGDIYQGLLFYVQAIKAIKPHANEDLTYKDIEDNLNLGADIFSAIQSAFKKIHIEAEQTSYLIQFSKELEIPLALHTYYLDDANEKRPVANLPLNFYFSKGEGELSPSGYTNYDGYIACDIKRLISKRKNQEITAIFNADKLFDSEDEETKVLLKAFFLDEFLPATQFNIEVQKSLAYIDMNEVVFGDSSSAQTFNNMMRSELAQSYFNITQNKEDADFIVKINSEFIAGDEKKGKGYSLFIVYVEFHLSITDNKNHMEIFADGFSGLKGMLPGNYEYALKKARENARQKVVNDILPKMEMVNL